MTLESSKTLGGVGAILILAGTLATSFSYGVITIVGVILVFIAMNGLADYYKDRSIFSNAIYSLVSGIVGVVAAAAAALYIHNFWYDYTNKLSGETLSILERQLVKFCGVNFG